ncbi:MAG: hypothetical protein QXR53_05025 [Candidatus Norongarragalinales archaeon]
MQDEKEAKAQKFLALVEGAGLPPSEIEFARQLVGIQQIAENSVRAGSRLAYFTVSLINSSDGKKFSAVVSGKISASDLLNAIESVAPDLFESIEQHIVSRYFFGQEIARA